jgi:hypothetical protein
MSSLQAFCDTVADVAVSEAKRLRDQFVDLAAEETPDPTHVFTTFAFMNWTFAAGVWSNVSHSRLRRDLLSGLKDALIMRLARNLAEGTSAQAAKCIFLTEEFNDYVTEYKMRMLTLGHADSNTATLFALERIQVRNGLDDSIMNCAVLKLIRDVGLASAVESVAREINIAAAETEDKGFFRRLFGG